MDYSKKQRLTRNLASLRDCEKAMPVGAQNNIMNNGTNGMMNNETNKMMNNGTNGMMNNEINMMMNNCMMEEMEQFPIAMAYVPWQHINTVYDSRKALRVGTIFPELDLPFCGVRGGRV